MPGTAAKSPASPRASSGSCSPRQSTSALGGVTSFRTEFGWIAVGFRHDAVASLKFGHSDQQSALAALPAEAVTKARHLTKWQRNVEQRLQAFLAGQVVDLSDIEVEPQWKTPFASRVVEVCRSIGYGETLSYGELAAIAGSPGAARAVGNVMSANEVPIVIPCHRVIGSQGALGGYSARGGTAVKQRLLKMEAAGLRKRS